MAEQILTFSFGWKMLVVLGWAGLFFAAACWYSKKKRTVAADLFRVPITNVLSILGLLFPIQLGLLAYLFSQDPKQPFTFLAAAICALSLTLVVVIYQTFTIAGKATAGGEITLTPWQSVWQMASLGTMYTSLLIGILYTVLFVVFEMKATSDTSNSPSGVFIARSPLHIGQPSAEVQAMWGQPEATADGGKNWRFSTPSSVIHVSFSSAMIVEKITETAKDK